MTEPQDNQATVAVEQAAAAFVELFGRPPLNMPELVKRIVKDSWPAEVVLSPIDFIGLSAFVNTQRDPEGRAFFWIANTKVLCKLPREGLLNLSGYDGPSRILTPRFGGSKA